MAIIPAGVTILWPGTAASIPSGWSRVTALDSLHTRGADAGVDPGTAGGNVAHTHGCDPHDHGLGAVHSHAGGTSGSALWDTTMNVTGPGSVAVSEAEVAHDHTHTFAGSPTAQSPADSVSTGWGSVTVEPPYYGVIYIRSDGTPTGFPSGALCYWGTSSPPSGFSQYAPSEGRYLKGAVANANGGATGGGTAHTHSASAHSHSVGNHSHALGFFSGAGGTQQVLLPASPSGPNPQPFFGFYPNHVHYFQELQAVSAQQTTLTTSADTGSQTYDPPYRELAAVTTDGTNPRPIGVICLWLGTLAQVPPGWALCDGTASTPDMRGRFALPATVLADVGTTGGALGHTHSAPGTHTHSDPGHQHGILTGAAYLAGYGAVSLTNTNMHIGHTYTFGAPTATGGYAATAQDVIAAADSRPPFLDVAFISAPGLLTAVAITSPADGATITQNNPTVSWTLDGGHTQQSYVLTLYADDGVTVLYTASVTTATQSATVPAGHIHNGLHYKLAVSVVTTDRYMGDSPQNRVLAQFTASPTVTGVTATAENSDQPPDVLVTWTIPTITAGQTYVQTNIERRVVGDTAWAVIGSVAVVGTTSYRDYTALGSVAYEYTVTVTTLYGGDPLVSAEGTPAQATLSFVGVWVHLHADPSQALQFLGATGSSSPTQDQAVVPVWGRQQPTVHVGDQQWLSWEFDSVYLIYPAYPDAPGPHGGPDPWQTLWAFATSVRELGPQGVLVVRFGAANDGGFGVIDWTGAGGHGSTQRKDELGGYTVSLVITQTYVDPSA